LNQYWQYFSQEEMAKSLVTTETLPMCTRCLMYLFYWRAGIPELNSIMHNTKKYSNNVLPFVRATVNLVLENLVITISVVYILSSLAICWNSKL